MPSQLPPSLVALRDSARTVLQYDVIVVGGGIAGLALTLRLPQTFSVALFTKGALGESNTRYAQGGLAAAIGPTDNPDLHFADTMASGAGLCDADTVRALVEGGPAAVNWLLDQGTRFDREHGALALGLEAAHSRHRVVHAGGDATGAEIERSLVQQIHDRANITLFEHATAIDLVRGPGNSSAVVGATVLLNNDTSPTLFNARMTVLANGGAGQIWAVSSNPSGATGDGIAMALRAGIEVADLEFTQFHPTVFSAPGVEPFLMTEAIRGEGGWLRSENGSRFMIDQHPLAELAPRDIVARAVQSQMELDGTDSVSLDLRHLDPDLVRHRFPTILTHLARYDLDLTSDPIPVAPAAHYFIGGIVADSSGRTSAPGLLALGEVSCTGVHGANRLASNSLLEGLVFGLEAADRIAGTGLPDLMAVEPIACEQVDHGTAMIEPNQLGRIQRLMSDDVAVVRSEASLNRARKKLEALGDLTVGIATTREIELRNAHVLARCIVDAARERRESRGSHFRSDFPAFEPGLENQHQLAILEDGVVRRRFGSLASSLPANTGADR